MRLELLGAASAFCAAILCVVAATAKNAGGQPLFSVGLGEREAEREKWLKKES